MFRTAISTDIQELMNNQRKALGDLAEQVAGEATSSDKNKSKK